MSIATKNTITNFASTKMENFSNNRFNPSLLVKDTNNNVLNKVKLNNMMINNPLAEEVSDLKSAVTTVTNGCRTLSGGTAAVMGPPTKKVLVIYTGGTIGMLKSPDSEGLVPIPNMLEKTVRSFPNFHAESLKTEENLLVLPKTDSNSSRVAYKIAEYNPLLDSSNMTIEDWIFIAQDIKANYEYYDGFVVLHGTDTMAYTASALSFMLENLGKSVVVTGSQIPLFESRSDGKENFLGALIMAGQYVIPEVSVYFGHKLFRGNRTTKVSSDRLNAFDSPNSAPLATLGINIDIDWTNMLQTKEPFRLNTSLNKNVALLRLYPSITAQTVKAFLQAPIEGVVLQTYGAGNFPTNRLDLLKELEDASRRGVIIVNCTQCGHGTVAAIYETGVKTESAGVIPGFDMTCEGAMTKLSYVLGRTDLTVEDKRAMMKVSLRGELTSPIKLATASSKEVDFVMEVDDMTDVRSSSQGHQKQTNLSQPLLPLRRQDHVNVNVPLMKSQMASIGMVQTVLNNGAVVPAAFQPQGILTMNDLASLLGHAPGRSPMWQIASVIFAGQLLLLFCLAIVL